jgi:hypothetical protein
MTFRNRLRLRDNWPLWVAGVGFLLIISRLLYGLPKYGDLPKSPVIYPLFVVVNSLVSLLILCVVAVVILFFVGSWAFTHRKLRSFAILGIFLLFPPLSCFTVYSVFFDGAQLDHVQSLEFDGHIYHLGEVDANFWDDPHISVVVYKCDIAGILCSLYYEGNETAGGSFSDVELNTALFIDAKNNQLMLRVEQVAWGYVDQLPIASASK